MIERMAILFPLGVRLTTWLVVLVFALIAAWHSERAPLLAMIAWLASFEAAYQVAAMTLHTPSPVPIIGPVSISLIIGMPLAALAMILLGAKADLRVLGLAILVFVAWVATGFHVNTSRVFTSPIGEALNDGAKTLWAIAFLLPLIRGRRETSVLPVASEESRALRPRTD